MAAITATSIVENDSQRGVVVRRYTCTVDLSNLSDGGQDVVSVAIPDAQVGDAVIAQSRTALLAGTAIANARVSAAGTVEVLVNNTAPATARDNASATWDITIIRGREGLAHAG